MRAKRLLVYIAVIIACLFIGLTTYYMLKDYETLNTILADGSTISLNKGDTFELKIERNRANENTTFTSTYDEKIISYDFDSGVLTAVSGGTTILTITSSNENLPVYKFTVEVGDGSDSSPWFIKTEEDLRNIGTKHSNGELIWTLENSYKLYNDIELTENWTPIAGYKTITDGLSEPQPVLQYFKGKFDGNGHTIRNLVVEGDYYTAGLFGAIGDFGEISNLTIENSKLEGYFYYAGFVAGIDNGTNIERVFVKNSTIILNERTTLELLPLSYGGNMDTNQVGGLVGLTQAQTKEGGEVYSSFTLCSFDGNITVANENVGNTQYVVGGLLGYDLGAEIINNYTNVAFILSESLASVTDTSKAQVGGLVGASYFKDSNRSEFSVDKDKEISYSVIKNNLTQITTNNVTVRMGGSIGQLAFVPENVADIKTFLAGRNIEKTDEEINALVSTFQSINSNISVRVSGNVYNYFGESVLTANYETYGCVSKTSEQIKNLETFEELDWSISTLDKASEVLSAWLIDDGNSIAVININGTREVSAYSNNTIDIDSKEKFADIVKKLLDDTDLSAQRYYLTRNYNLLVDVDLSEIEDLATWTPIGQGNAFSGTFNGNGHTISNLTISQNDKKFEFVGMFAKTSSQAVIKDLILENVTIDYANIGGAFVGINEGTIENCQVEAIAINNSAVAGFITGFNNGKIITNKTIGDSDILQYTVLENREGENKIVSTEKAKNIFLGGVSGYNNGIINGIKIQSNFTLVGETTKDYSYAEMMGGIAGFNAYDASILNSSVENANIKNLSTNYLYIGGIAGISNGLIERCHAGSQENGLSLSITASTKEGDHVVGGLVGQLSTGAKIKQSFVNGDITSYMAGGIGSLVFGEVNECYVKGTISGHYVGGFAVQLSLTSSQKEAGHINNCYVKATLNGIDETSRVAGIATYIIRPALVENVVLSVNFTGNGANYYESYTDTRTWIYNQINNITGKQLGRIVNVVINESANTASAKKNGGLILDKSQTVYYVNEETLKSGEEFYADKEFNIDEIWTFDADAVPVLKNLNIDGIEQIIVIAEGNYLAEDNSEENSVSLNLGTGNTFTLKIVKESAEKVITGSYSNNGSSVILTYSEKALNENGEQITVQKTILGTYAKEVEKTTITLSISENEESILVLSTEETEGAEEAEGGENAEEAPSTEQAA